MPTRSEGPVPSEAVVQTGGVETWYRRAGHGPSLLLLLPSGSRRHRDALFDRLSMEVRVVEPTALRAPDSSGWVAMALDPPRWEAWLRDVIEGLGLDRPWLAVEPALAHLAECFVDGHPGHTSGAFTADVAEPDRVLAALRERA